MEGIGVVPKKPTHHIVECPQIRIFLGIRPVVPARNGSSDPRRCRSVVEVVWTGVKSENRVNVDLGEHLSS